MAQPLEKIKPEILNNYRNALLSRLPNQLQRKKDENLFSAIWCARYCTR